MLTKYVVFKNMILSHLGEVGLQGQYNIFGKYNILGDMIYKDDIIFWEI